MRKLQKDGQNKPKIYTDRKQFEQAKRMYNDSLNLYNDGLKSIKELNDNKIAWNIRPLDKYLYDGLKKINPGALPIAEVQYNTGRSLNSGERESDGSNNYTKSSRFLYKQPVQPVVYQPQETITSPQTVSSQHGKKGMWGAEYDKKHPPIYVTNPKDPRIGQYGKDGNQYLYKGPTHPIQKMSRINPQQMDLNSQVNIQGQSIPMPAFQFPQQKGTPVYGPGNTIIGYSDNMNFKPAYQYTGAPNNPMNLQDKALLNDHEALRKYVSSRDNYKFQIGGQTFDEYLRQQNKPITDKNNFSKVPYTQQQSQSLINQRNTEKRLAQEKLNQEIAARNTKSRGDKFQLPSGQNKYYSQMSPKEKFYIDGLSLQNKGRWNENEVEQPFLNSLNPVKWIYDMAGNLGKAPMDAKTSNSNLPYLSAIGEPLLAGALGFSPLDFAGNQLSKNFLKKSFTPNLNNIGTESFTPRFKGARTDAIDFMGREEIGSPTFGGYGYPTQVSGAGMNSFPNTPNKFLNGEYSSFGNMQKGVMNNNIPNTQNNIYNKMNIKSVTNPFNKQSEELQHLQKLELQRNNSNMQNQINLGRELYNNIDNPKWMRQNVEELKKENSFRQTFPEKEKEGMMGFITQNMRLDSDDAIFALDGYNPYNKFADLSEAAFTNAQNQAVSQKQAAVTYFPYNRNIADLRVGAHRWKDRNPYTELANASERNLSNKEQLINNKDWLKTANWEDVGMEMRGVMKQYGLDPKNEADVRKLIGILDYQKLNNFQKPNKTLFTNIPVNKLGGTTKKLKKYKC
jgi:hypothetical protein